MCTYSITVDDAVLEKVRPVLPNNKAVEAWMQSQMDMLLLQLAESLNRTPKAMRQGEPNVFDVAFGAGEPRSLTAEEARALTLQRGRDIKAGRTKLIAHETEMQEMEQMLATYAK